MALVPQLPKLALVELPGAPVEAGNRQALRHLHASAGGGSVYDLSLPAQCIPQPRRLDGMRPNRLSHRDAAHLIRDCSRIGISRIADITGLDRLGIPVVQAVRPLALSNAVSQGKGPDREQAVVSAVLEAAETFFAEKVEDIPSFKASADDLAVPAGRFDRHLLADAPHNWRSLEIPWTEGTDVVAGRRQPVPLELVHTCFVHPPLAGDGVFCGSTTGLAAAFNQEQAALHALLETIERDAVACAQRIHGLFVHARIDETSIGDETVRDLLDRVAAAGLLTGLWALEGAGSVPVFWCQIMESGEQPVLMPFAAEGFAAHADPAIAVIKAVVEAAQARLAAISGARDDITRAVYPSRIDDRAVEAQRRLLRDGPRPIRFETMLDDSQDLADDLDGVLSRLCSAGIQNVIVVPLGHDADLGVMCVRVLVPGLEPLLE